jgi:hypothetical protein
MPYFALEPWRHMQRLMLLCSLVLSLAWSQAGLAHGGGVPQLTDAPAGPYRLFAWSSPDPWQSGVAAHLTVAVTMLDAAGQTTPVSDAQVTVVLTAEGQPTQRAQFEATPNPTAAGFYEADGELPVAGLWYVEVLVSGVAGTGSGAFTNIVQPGSSINWPLWLGIGVGLLALVGFIGLRQHTAKVKAPPAAAGAVCPTGVKCVYSQNF